MKLEMGDKIYSGITVMQEKGEAIITETGMDTELGNIAEKIQRRKKILFYRRRSLVHNEDYEIHGSPTAENSKPILYTIEYLPKGQTKFNSSSS